MSSRRERVTVFDVGVPALAVFRRCVCLWLKDVGVYCLPAEYWPAAEVTGLLAHRVQQDSLHGCVRVRMCCVPSWLARETPEGAGSLAASHLPFWLLLGIRLRNRGSNRS